MYYKEVLPIDADTLQFIFKSGDTISICRGLVAMAFYEENWRLAQETCLDFLEHDNVDIASVAATCLGHIARIHGTIEKSKVTHILRGKMKNPLIAGTIQDALNDINMFAPD